MEKLNTKSILEKIANNTKSTQSGVYSIKEGSVITKFNKYYEGENFVDYTEEDLSTGISVSIIGNVKDGLTKQILDRNNPKIEIIKYYLSGNVHTIKYIYSDKYLKNSPGNTEYPIDTISTYTEDGVLVESINVDDAFKFSIIDLRELLSQKGDGLIIRRIEGVYDIHDPIWRVDYSTSDLGVCSMRINARTGAILNDYHHMTTIE